MDTVPIKKILLVQTGFIGDVILSTPVISALSEIYPQAEITLLTTPLASQLFSADVRLKEVIVYDKRGSHRGLRGFFEILKKLKDSKYEVVFSLHKSYRTSLLLALSRIPKRFGFKEAKISFLYSSVTSRSEYDHDVLRNLAILKNINQDPKTLSRPLSLQIPEALKSTMMQKISGLTAKKTIVVAPGSVWLTKKWTDEGYLELVSCLIRDGYNVVLIGSKADLDIGMKIDNYLVEQGVGEKSYLNMIGKLNLLESAAMVSVAELIIANDSAPLHIASSTGTPVVAIFCATVPEFGFGPWMNRHEILEVKGLECRPCGRHGSNICPTGTNFCQNKITVEQVLSAAGRIINA